MKKKLIKEIGLLILSIAAVAVIVIGLVYMLTK